MVFRCVIVTRLRTEGVAGATGGAGITVGCKFDGAKYNIKLDHSLLSDGNYLWNVLAKYLTPLPYGG